MLVDGTSNWSDRFPSNSPKQGLLLPSLYYGSASESQLIVFCFFTLFHGLTWLLSLTFSPRLEGLWKLRLYFARKVLLSWRRFFPFDWFGYAVPMLCDPLWAFPKIRIFNRRVVRVPVLHINLLNMATCARGSICGLENTRHLLRLKGGLGWDELRRNRKHSFWSSIIFIDQVLYRSWICLVNYRGWVQYGGADSFTPSACLLYYFSKTLYVILMMSRIAFSTKDWIE
jgi:hypothetical protein